MINGNVKELALLWTSDIDAMKLHNNISPIINLLLD
jgi:hypothetical protein